MRVFYGNVPPTPAGSSLKPPSRNRWPLAALICLAGVLGMTAIWGTAAVMTGRALGGLALLAAADIVLLLRLSGAPSGRSRRGLALAGLGATVLISNWLLAAAVVGSQMGLSPLRSAPRLSPDLAWLVAWQANGPLDLAAIAGAFALAWWWGR